VSRKRIFNLLKIAVSLSLIFFILLNIDLDQLKNSLLQANLAWLLVALALVLVNIGVRARRWQILLNALQVRVPLKELTTIYFIGAAFNNLLPSGVGGDAIRAVELNQYTSRVSDAITSVLVDRFLGLYGSLMLGFITLIFAWQRVPVEVTIISVTVFVGMSIAGVVLINEPIYRALRRIGLFRKLTDIKFVYSLFESFQDYKPGALAQAFVMGLLVNLFLIAINITIGLALGIKIALIYYLTFVPLVNLILVVPITFAGFGTREPTYIYLFTQVGVLPEAALALSLLIYLLGNLVPGLLGGAIYLWRSARGLRLESKQKVQ